MRKKYFYLLSFFMFISCDNKEDEKLQSQSTKNVTQTYIINGDIEYVSEIIDKSRVTKPKLVYDIPNQELKTELARNITSKVAGQSIINFNYGIGDPTNSGCTIKKYNDGDSYMTDSGVYGPNPAKQNDGYLIRGAGLPHHNYPYGSLVLIASNRGHQAVSRGQVYNDNTCRGSAISIEYPFKANTTYEISLTTYFNDNILLVDKVNSNGFPTIYVQLKDSGSIIEGQQACNTDNIITFIESNPNYLKSYTLEDNIKKEKIITFKFSPLEEKKALLIALNPKIGERGIGTKIPTNSYTMPLRYVTITEKPFDSSLIIPIPKREIDRAFGGNSRR